MPITQESIKELVRDTLHEQDKDMILAVMASKIEQLERRIEELEKERRTK